MAPTPSGTWTPFGPEKLSSLQAPLDEVLLTVADLCTARVEKYRAEYPAKRALYDRELAEFERQVLKRYLGFIDPPVAPLSPELVSPRVAYHVVLAAFGKRNEAVAEALLSVLARDGLVRIVNVASWEAWWNEYVVCLTEQGVARASELRMPVTKTTVPL